MIVFVLLWEIVWLRRIIVFVNCERLSVCAYMAPKTKSGAGSSQSFDASKFLSFETQKKFTDQLKIHVIQERGLVHKLQHRVNWTIDANR